MNHLFLGALAAVAFCGTQAQAIIIITPATSAILTGDQTSQSQIDAAIASTLAGATPPAVELYKADVGEEEAPATVESGALAGSYTTTFANTALDPEDATIVYDGGNFVGPTAFLLVKDGNADPVWYLFNLTALFSWNGKETLQLEDFWPNGGAISHVTLYGVSTMTPPEPNPVPDNGATLALFGLSLVGLRALARKMKV